ncbi:MAG: hypothetical protein SVS85_04390, partial [Candidatus Nanohaloarchaea archaeon]|nr:hypothetical protein [Candidatus Nanohaloarchaea archaeon]
MNPGNGYGPTGELVDDFEPGYAELEHREDPVTVMTGMTFDSQGSLPADLLKQVAAAAGTAEYLRGEGREAEVEVLVGDSFVAMGRNPGDSYPRSEIPAEVERRADDLVEVLKNLGDEYIDDVPYTVRRTSEVSEDGEYRRIVREGERAAAENPELRGLLASPGKRNGREPEEAVPYTLHELACIASTGTDLKTGPRSESDYDSIARSTEFRDAVGLEGEGLVSAYVTPTLPTLQSVRPGDVDDIREEGGLVPYHGRYARIEMDDEQGEVEERLEHHGAPLRLERDLSALAEFLEDRSPSGGEDLVEQLSHGQGSDTRDGGRRVRRGGRCQDRHVPERQPPGTVAGRGRGGETARHGIDRKLPASWRPEREGGGVPGRGT